MIWSVIKPSSDAIIHRPSLLKTFIIVARAIVDN
jgi:hypothetical protein